MYWWSMKIGIKSIYTWAHICTLSHSLVPIQSNFFIRGLPCIVCKKVDLKRNHKFKNDGNWSSPSQRMQQLTISLSSQSLASSCPAGQSNGKRWQALINTSHASLFISSFRNTTPSLQKQRLTKPTTRKVCLFACVCVCVCMCAQQRKRDGEREIGSVLHLHTSSIQIHQVGFSSFSPLVHVWCWVTQGYHRS